MSYDTLILLIVEWFYESFDVNLIYKDFFVFVIFCANSSIAFQRAKQTSFLKPDKRSTISQGVNDTPNKRTRPFINTTDDN